MPDGEDGSGDGCHRVDGEVCGGEGCGEAGVLHADFDADGGALGRGEAECAGDGIAEGEPDEVVQDDGECHEVTAGDDVGGVVGDDDGDDCCYGKGGYHGEQGCDFLAEGAEVVVDDDAEEDGEDDDLGDAGEHGCEVYMDGLPCEQ